MWNERYGDMTGKSLLQQNPGIVEAGLFDRFVEVYQDVPVLIMSASPGIRELAAAAGADGAIEKPFTVETLRETVDLFTLA